MVEALTIVVAAGVSRGWRPALEGAAAALLVLGVLVLVVGVPLIRYIPLDALRAQIERIDPVGGALRLGVLYDLLGRTIDADIRGVTVEHFVGRYAIDRAHAARGVPILRAVSRLWHSESSCRRQLFDIVIRGRGTWAAARSQAREKSRAVTNRAFRTLAFFSNKIRHESDVFRILHGFGSHQTPSCQVANNDEASRESSGS